MKFRILVVTALSAAGLSACDSGGHPSIDGKWTPVGVSDCSGNGRVMEFAGSKMIYRAGRNKVEVGQITDVTETQGRVDLHYLTRDISKPGSKFEGAPAVIRFDSSVPDRLRAIEVSDDGVHFTSADNSSVGDDMNLIRCGAKTTTGG